MSTALTMLETTRKILSEDGWIQGFYRNEDGCCLEAALLEAADRDYEEIAKRKARLKAEGVPFPERSELDREVRCARQDIQKALQIALKGDGDYRWLINWNDRTGRTVEEVFAALDAAEEVLVGEAADGLD